MRFAGWRRRRPRRPPYLGHLRPQVDLLQVDGVRPEVVEQLAEQDSIAEGLSQVEHLRRVPGHPVVGGQHLAVDEPQRALLPRLHARRLRDAAGQGQAARMQRRPPRFLRLPDASRGRPVSCNCTTVRESRSRGRRTGCPARVLVPVSARVHRRPTAAASESRALFVRPGRLGGGDRAQASYSRARRRATEHAQRAGQSRCRLRIPRGAGGRARAALAWGRRPGRGRGGEGRGAVAAKGIPGPPPTTSPQVGGAHPAPGARGSSLRTPPRFGESASEQCRPVGAPVRTS